MEITRPDAKTVLISQLDQLLCELLQRIGPSADPGDSAAARARLFSAPSHDEGEEELREDWRDYVEPELAKVFLTTIEVIERDLIALNVDAASGVGFIAIPFSHLENWIHGLNQARLALAARYDFSEADMENKMPFGADDRSLALLQIRFYGFLQEVFLHELEGH